MVRVSTSCPTRDFRVFWKGPRPTPAKHLPHCHGLEAPFSAFLFVSGISSLGGNLSHLQPPSSPSFSVPRACPFAQEHELYSSRTCRVCSSMMFSASRARLPAPWSHQPLQFSFYPLLPELTTASRIKPDVLIFDK